jgi:hypothetical protein
LTLKLRLKSEAHYGIYNCVASIDPLAPRSTMSMGRNVK